jgi:AcrR family transcriptional regulator
MTDPQADLAPRRTARRAGEAGKAALDRQAWVRGATAMLVDGGVDAVRVDVLAKAQGVTRGSFYWHFKDRDELLSHVLAAWRDAANEQIIERFERKASAPRELSAERVALPLRGAAARRAAGIELAMRDWARRDPAARQAVDDVDAHRISYTALCFSALGHPIKQARARACALYAYTVGLSLLAGQGTDEQQRERNAIVLELLQAPMP